MLRYSEKLEHGDVEQARWTLKSAAKKFDGFNLFSIVVMKLIFVVASLLHVPGGRRELYYRALCLFRLASVEKNVAKAIR